MPRIFIDSFDDPRVKMYRDLKTSNLLRDGKLFIAEGTKLVERLIASDFRTESVLVAERREEEWSTRVPPDVPLYVIPQKLGEQLTGFNFHVGVLACGVRKPSPSLDEVLAESSETTIDARTDIRDGGKARHNLTIAICPNCDNPENMGAIIRICAALGVDALLLAREGCCDPFSRRVLRVSMGAAFTLPIIESTNLERDLIRLRDEWHVELIASVLDPHVETLAGSHRSSRIGVLFGNEADGLGPRWLGFSHRQVTIPMRLGTDSLNVGVAAGIFLHHFQEQASIESSRAGG